MFWLIIIIINEVIKHVVSEINMVIYLILEYWLVLFGGLNIMFGQIFRVARFGRLEEKGNSQMILIFTDHTMTLGSHS